jgi:hypothetical protein
LVALLATAILTSMVFWMKKAALEHLWLSGRAEPWRSDRLFRLPDPGFDSVLLVSAASTVGEGRLTDSDSFKNQ